MTSHDRVRVGQPISSISDITDITIHKLHKPYTSLYIIIHQLLRAHPTKSERPIAATSEPVHRTHVRGRAAASLRSSRRSARRTAAALGSSVAQQQSRPTDILRSNTGLGPNGSQLRPREAADVGNQEEKGGLNGWSAESRFRTGRWRL